MPTIWQRCMTKCSRYWRYARSHGPIRTCIRAPDGSWLHLEIMGTNVTEDPNVRGVVVNARDITERVEAPSELRKSEIPTSVRPIPLSRGTPALRPAARSA